MRIVILSDLHLVSAGDPFKEIHPKRAHFAKAWRSAKRMCALVREAAPDLVISLGDLVDWYSDENRDFAIGMLNELNVPWVVTPGNHDFEIYPRNPNGTVGPLLPMGTYARKTTAAWNAHGIEFGNRVIDAGDTGLLLMHSAFSTVPKGTREWLNRTLPKHRRNLVFTHCPLDIPQLRKFILSVDPRRNLKKYVQSGAPPVFEECLRGRVQKIFFGHLHFGGELSVDGTMMYVRGLSVAAVGRKYPEMGQAMILDLDGSEPKIISL